MKLHKVLSIVIILDGNSEIGAHARSDLGDLICLSHLSRTRAVINLIFQEDLFSSRHAQRALSYHLMQVPLFLIFFYRDRLSFTLLDSREKFLFFTKKKSNLRLKLD